MVGGGRASSHYYGIKLSIVICRRAISWLRLLGISCPMFSRPDAATLYMDTYVCMFTYLVCVIDAVMQYFLLWFWALADSFCIRATPTSDCCRHGIANRLRCLWPCLLSYPFISSEFLILLSLKYCTVLTLEDRDMWHVFPRYVTILVVAHIVV